MSTPLPPYSGGDGCGPGCAKCGFDVASTEYVRSRSGIVADLLEIDNAPLHAEFLKRECRRCGYAWAESCRPPLEGNQVPQCEEVHDTLGRCDVYRGHGGKSHQTAGWVWTRD